MKYIVIPQDKLPAKYSVRSARTSSLAKYFDYGYKNVDALPESQKLIKLNPSLVLLKKTDDYAQYILTYRAIYPLKKANDLRMPRAPGTMWRTKWISEWTGTGYCKLKIYKGGKISISNDTVDTNLSEMDDARIFKQASAMYLQFGVYTYWQDFPKTASRELRKSPDYKTGLCIVQMIQEIAWKNNKIKLLGKPKVLCEDYHERYEKNWASVTERPGLYHYSFAPEFIFLQEDSKTVVRTPTQSDFFIRLWKYYKKYFPGEALKCGISCSSPLIDYTATEYLGIGHMKISYEELEFSKVKQGKDPLFVFIRELAKLLGLTDVDPKQWSARSEFLNSYTGYIYWSFFYTIRKETLELDSFSPAFLPQNNFLPYVTTITFPTSIEHFLDDKFVVSQGISDINCGLMIFSRDEINKLLKYKNDLGANKYDFIVF